MVRPEEGTFNNVEERAPRVPRDTAFHVFRSQICRRNSTVDVLPLVPVTATMKPGLDVQNVEQAIANRPLTLSERSNVISFGITKSLSSAKIATAPFFIALSMYLCPSEKLPEKAANKEPLRTLRESLVR